MKIQIVILHSIITAVFGEYSPGCPSQPSNCTVDCKFGYRKGWEGCPICFCNEPCQALQCDSNEVCIIKRVKEQYQAQCISQFDDCPPGIDRSECFVSACKLSSCVDNKSLRCLPDFCGGCFARFFDPSGHDITEQCFSLSNQQLATKSKNGRCPALENGYCLHMCTSHDDCLGERLCCSNGCGRLCVPPVIDEDNIKPSIIWTTQRLTSSQWSTPNSQEEVAFYNRWTSPMLLWSKYPLTSPNVPLSSTPTPLTFTTPSIVSSDQKIGQCPSSKDALPQPCNSQCSSDTECPSVRKCCWNGCTQRCLYPINASPCALLRAAIEQLPWPGTQDGWLPTCTPSGEFTSVQCNRKECWCVDRDGWELPRTRNQDSQPDCRNTMHNCPQVACPLQCPHGFMIDDLGCRTCECVDLCKTVVCGRDYEMCHLVISSCDFGFNCTPVPKCIPNICPIGVPVGPGICKIDNDCPLSAFCHQIGYQDWGLCCPKTSGIPAILTSIDQCSNTLIGAGGQCRLECRSSADCSSTSYSCCFNGCGSSCIATSNNVSSTSTLPSTSTVSQQPETTTYNSFPTSTTAFDLSIYNRHRYNLFTSTRSSRTDGSSSLSTNRGSSKAGICPKTEGWYSPCLQMCHSDDDCPGTRKCCPAGCSTRCASPLQRRYTAAMDTTYSTQELQFNFTTSLQSTTATACPQLNCQHQCQAGREVDKLTGCETCTCLDPCKTLNCLNPGEICLMLPTWCSDGNCKPKPICVQNVCPRGIPVRDNSTEHGIAVRCGNGLLCPQETWCRQVGLDDKGFCCPFPVAAVHPGVCPSISFDSASNASSLGQPVSLTCGRSCASDDQCAPEEKCCYTNCGYLACIAPAGSATKTTSAEKEGVCPAQDISNKDNPSRRACIQQCINDFDCPSDQKCCLQACSKLCISLQPTQSSSDVDRNVIAIDNGTMSTLDRTPARKEEHVGRCPDIIKRSECATDISECSQDIHCPNSLAKCCFDGCSKSCMYPQATTACLHFSISMERANLTHLKPQCKPNGDFKEEQCRGNTCWCVTSRGNKMPGTLNFGRANCNAPRLCSLLLNCSLICPHGFKLDNTGCPICACDNPCSEIQCPTTNQICMMTTPSCLEENLCTPIPTCLVNVCTNGTPAMQPQSDMPISCSGDLQCNAGLQCVRPGTADGYCCSGQAPINHPGQCPRAQLTNQTRQNCEKACRSDMDCTDTQKCCFNGCGLQCVSSASQRSGKCPVDFPEVKKCKNECVDDYDCNEDSKCCGSESCRLCLPTEGVKVGECPAVQPATSEFCNQGLRVNQCKQDNDCPSAQKCCKDGCGRMLCTYPFATTSCLHYKSSSDQIISAGGQFSKRGWRPQCLANGQYAQIQCDRAVCWCVDGYGVEIPGTRTETREKPPCDSPRNCPPVACNLNCLFGFKLDQSGCEMCGCYDPCEEVQCGKTEETCRLETLECISGNCLPTPKCYLNTCPSGEPMRDTKTWLTSQCSNATLTCPSTHFCLKTGYLTENGVCCQQPKPEIHNGQCPVTSKSPLTDAQKCQRGCRQDSDCPNTDKCCYNGCTLQCLMMNSGSSVDNSFFTRIIGSTAQIGGNTASTLISKPTVQSIKLGICPPNPISNPGCQTECQADDDCPNVLKCCSFGCGRQCQMPINTTGKPNNFRWCFTLEPPGILNYVNCPFYRTI